jgi:hypothetical protein
MSTSMKLLRALTDTGAFCVLFFYVGLLCLAFYGRLSTMSRWRVRQGLLYAWCSVKLLLALALSPLLWLLFQWAPVAFLPVFTFLWPHLDILGEDDALYLRRFFMTPKTQLYRPRFLHYINRSDEGRDPHDHPGRFTTKILHGGYVEKVYWPGDPFRKLNGVVVETKFCLPGAVLDNQVGHTHMLTLAGSTWSWVIGWKRGSPWGFWALDAKDGANDRWVESESYGLKGREVKSWVVQP